MPDELPLLDLSEEFKKNYKDYITNIRSSQTSNIKVPTIYALMIHLNPNKTNVSYVGTSGATHHVIHGKNIQRSGEEKQGELLEDWSFGNCGESAAIHSQNCSPNHQDKNPNIIPENRKNYISIAFKKNSNGEIFVKAPCKNCTQLYIANSNKLFGSVVESNHEYHLIKKVDSQNLISINEQRFKINEVR